MSVQSNMIRPDQIHSCINGGAGYGGIRQLGLKPKHSNDNIEETLYRICR